MTETQSSLLSDTDTKILLSFTEAQTMSDGLLTAGVSYEYGKKRVGKLVKLGYLFMNRQGTKVIYQTCRNSETQLVFHQAETRSSTTKEYRFIHNGRYLTLGEAVNEIARSTDKLKGGAQRLNRITAKVISQLKVRSYSKARGNPIQNPDETGMRQLLSEHIMLAKRELKLAEEVYNAMILWGGGPNVWKIISSLEPTDGVLKAAEDLNKLFTR